MAILTLSMLISNQVYAHMMQIRTTSFRQIRTLSLSEGEEDAVSLGGCLVEEVALLGHLLANRLVT